jgi:quercetin dioxygenase-like cupin family protein
MGTALLSFENTTAEATRARVVRFGGAIITVHVDSAQTGGKFALIEMSGEPGFEPPLHVHHDEYRR